MIISVHSYISIYTPYQVVKMINPNSKEDMELLREVLKNNDFDDEDE